MYIVIRKDREIFKLVTYPKVKPDTYEVSNYGNIRNLKTGKLVKLFPDTKGYPFANLMYKKSIARSVNIHRLVAWEFVDGYDIDRGRTNVNHLDSDPTNNYYENLEWVTTKENNQHGIKHGKIRFGAGGSLNYKARYNEEFCS